MMWFLFALLRNLNNGANSRLGSLSRVCAGICDTGRDSIGPKSLLTEIVADTAIDHRKYDLWRNYRIEPYLEYYIHKRTFIQFFWYLGHGMMLFVISFDAESGDLVTYDRVEVGIVYYIALEVG